MTEEIALDNQSRDLLNINQHQINHGVLYRPSDISYCTCERQRKKTRPKKWPAGPGLVEIEREGQKKHYNRCRDHHNISLYLELPSADDAITQAKLGWTKKISGSTVGDIIKAAKGNPPNVPCGC